MNTGFRDSNGAKIHTGHRVAINGGAYDDWIGTVRFYCLRFCFVPDDEPYKPRELKWYCGWDFCTIKILEKL